MKCPFCHHEDTQVLDTRVSEEGDTIRRRRRCGACDKRFTTYERIELNLPVIVKKNGSRIEFDPAKLRASLMLALRKRPVSAEAVDAAIQHIEEKLLSSGQREILSGHVGELVMRELKRLDKIAYIRFASVYKSFEDVTEFQEAVAEIDQEHKPPKIRDAAVERGTAISPLVVKPRLVRIAPRRSGHTTRQHLPRKYGRGERINSLRRPEIRRDLSSTRQAVVWS